MPLAVVQANRKLLLLLATSADGQRDHSVAQHERDVSLRLVLGSGGDEQDTVRVEGAEVKLDEEVLLPEVSSAVLDQRVAVISVAVFKGIRFVRVAAHLERDGLGEFPTKWTRTRDGLRFGCKIDKGREREKGISNKFNFYCTD